MKLQITLGEKTFKTQSECEQYTRSVLTELGVTSSVKNQNKKHFDFLLLLCKRHPFHIKKLIDFVDFKISYDLINKRALSLAIINSNNTITEIAWRTCVTGKGKSEKTLFNAALRKSVSNQIQEFRSKSNTIHCPECKNFLSDMPNHVDHHEPQFAELVEKFVDSKEIIMPRKYTKDEKTFETLFYDEDIWIGDSFQIYHSEHARLRIICEKCNLTRRKYKTSTKKRLRSDAEIFK
jgi:hypothetical protein